MKKFFTTTQIIVLVFLFWMAGGVETSFAQTRRVGDLYTFSDGSQGIVFYVDPVYPNRGCAVALSDLDTVYAIWKQPRPAGLNGVFSEYPYGPELESWTFRGQENTHILYNSGMSQAATAVRALGAEWYIPDAMQMRMIYGLLPVIGGPMEAAGGSASELTAVKHWTSSTVANNSTVAFSVSASGGFERSGAMYLLAIRPVRDYNDYPYAYWADDPPHDVMQVAPEQTSDYDAVVHYLNDSIVVTQTVEVYENYDKDTLRETTTVSTALFTSQINPVFADLDVSVPGEFVFRHRASTVFDCDSMITLVLTVNDHRHYHDTLCPLKEDYYFAPFDTVFQPGTVSGEYVHHGSKVVDDVTVDTTAFYHLTIMPEYELFDTVEWCLYEPDESRIYEQNGHITFETNDFVLSVTSNSESVVVEEVVPQADYVLKMQTVFGCDSVVNLHVETNRVTRDTLRHEVFLYQVEDETVVVDGYTFRPIVDPDTFILRDTLVAVNGCDSIVVVELVVSPCVTDFSITCPPDVYDTLVYGDCVMTIYPERIGNPTLHCEMEWPFVVSNDIPEEYLFAQGDNVVTWVMTDSVCGNSTSCEQHVVIAFPKCPDAVDCEGNVYHGVRIGCDCWTQRNLESRKYSDCVDIPDVYAYASWMFPDTSENVAVFGRLYSYEAAVRDSADNGHGHIQGICPEGWYLPTPEKYQGLNAYGADALRSPDYWVDGGGHNSTGFSALPAGFYNGVRNRYEGLLSETYFWSTEGVGSASKAEVSQIRYACDSVLQVQMHSGLGYSIRCIKEKE